MSRLNVDVSQGLPLSSPPVSLTYRNRRVRYWTPAKLPRVMLPRWDGGYGASRPVHAAKPDGPLSVGQSDLRRNAPQRARCAESGRSRDHDPATGVDPNCDIGRAVSWRPLPDPTADLWTLSVLAKESGRP